MILAYLSEKRFKPEIITPRNQLLLHDALWIDMLNATKEEEKLVESKVGLDIPTREEMQEIEISSRLYKENEILFMTVTMVAQSETLEPMSEAVTLILIKNQLITVRYLEPQSFALFIARLPKLPAEYHDSIHLIIELIDVSIDRLADILEKVSHCLDDYSRTIFRPQTSNSTRRKPDFKQHLQEIGLNGHLSTKVQESLITFNRLITFFGQAVSAKLDSDLQSKLNMLTKDIISLSDYVSFLANKVTFLLDATLGMVNIEQNNIIKIFSIAAVILLPPTLVASIYGMNFKHMPELAWYGGYPMALVFMLIAAWLPYKYFKMKRWL